MDGSGIPSRNGTIQILSFPEFRVISELTAPKDTVVDLKFSPDGNTLAASSVDNNVYLFTMGTVSTPSEVEGAKKLLLINYFTPKMIYMHICIYICI
jgi:WD40 repeat protein